MRDEADRVVTTWRPADAPATRGADVDDEDSMERALLAYAQRSAARVGAEWFAAEFARRDEDERLEREDAWTWRSPLGRAAPDMAPAAGLIDASVEDDVVGGTPAGLGYEPTPQPAVRGLDTPPPAISAAEWARMSPGARRLYAADARTDPA